MSLSINSPSGIAYGYVAFSGGELHFLVRELEYRPTYYNMSSFLALDSEILRGVEIDLKGIVLPKDKVPSDIIFQRHMDKIPVNFEQDQLRKLTI